MKCPFSVACKNLIKTALLIPVLGFSGCVALNDGANALPMPTTVLSGGIVVPPIIREHPRLWVTGERLLEIEYLITRGEQPWADVWSMRLLPVARESLNKIPQPYTGRSSSVFSKRIGEDAKAARDLALAWAISGEASFGEKAKSLLLAWARAEPLPASDFDPSIRYPNSGMELNVAAIPMVFAYDLIGQLPSFTNQERSDIMRLFRAFESVERESIRRWNTPGKRINGRYRESPEGMAYFGGQYFQNHSAAHVSALVALGYVMGDRDLVQFAIDSDENPRDWLEMLEGAILMPGDASFGKQGEILPGELYDRYRTHEGKGLSYSHKTLNLLLLPAEAAFHNGINLYDYTAPGGETLELPLEFLAPFYANRETLENLGYYEHAGEHERLRRLTDQMYAGIYELGNARFPGNKAIESVLCSVDRTRPVNPWLGYSVLTHGDSVFCEEDE